MGRSFWGLIERKKGEIKMDSKDYIIDKLAKKNAQLEVTNLEYEFAFLQLKQENEDLKKEIENITQAKENSENSKNKEE